MKQQENNFKYNNILNLGFWTVNLLELDTEKIIGDLYNIKKTTPSVRISNNGGYQSSSNLHLIPEFYFLVNFINNKVLDLTHNPNIKINNMWGNISSFTNFNEIHTHTHINHHLSGILYLKTPPQGGDLLFLNPLQIDNVYNYSPQEKDLVIFHGVIPHYVEPNLSQEDRISIAFNLFQ